MRKTLLFIVLIGLGLNVIAQDQPAVHQRKKFMMGFNVAPSVDWFGVSTQDVKLDAAKVKFQYGVVMEYAFANNYAILTGIEHKLAGAKLDYTGMAGDSKDFTKLPHYTTADDSTYYVDKRNYKLDYVNIPIMLKLMTNQIGYFTYFGKFGVDASFLVRARADEDGHYGSTPGVNVKTDNRNIYKEAGIFRVGLNVGAGAEWNFSGKTSLVMGVSYHHGFIDVLRDADADGVANDQMLATWTDGQQTQVSPFAQKANLQYVTLDVGILF